MGTSPDRGDSLRPSYNEEGEGNAKDVRPASSNAPVKS